MRGEEETAVSQSTNELFLSIHKMKVFIKELMKGGGTRVFGIGNISE